MLKVDIVYSRNIGIKNGVNKVILELLENRKKFLEEEIELEYPFNFQIIEDGKKESKKLILKLTSKLKEKKYLALVRGINYFYRGYKTIKNYEKKKRKKDIILFNDIFSMYFYKGTAKKILVVHSVGEYIEAFDGLNLPIFFIEFIKNIYEKCLKNSDLVIFLSKEMEERYSKTGISSSCIYNGIKVESIKNNIKNIEGKDKIKIIIVGNICERKGHLLLIKALEEMKRDGVDLSKLQINCFGNKSGLGEELEKRIKKSKLNLILNIKGISNNIEEELQKSDVYYMPSLSEGLPIALIEATKYKLPIVTTDVGSIKEIFGEAVIYFKPNSVEEIKKSLKLILKSSGTEEFKKLGEQSNEIFLQKLTSKIMVENYIKILKRIEV